MINDLKYIKEKTLELEESFEKLHKNSLKTYKTFRSFKKSFLNYSIINSSQIEILDLYLTKNSNIYLVLNLEFYLPSSQTVEFSLLINNICIMKSSKHFENGKNEIILNKDFSANATINYKMMLSIKSIDNKQIELNNANLLIYGIPEITNNFKYQTLDVDNTLLMSYLENGELFYLLANKNISYYNTLDFKYLTNAKDYCFVYDKENDEIFIFKIDNDNNLTFSKFDLISHQFIDSNVSSVSACFGNNIILVSYVKNSNVYYFIINNNSIGKICRIEQFYNIVKTNTFFNEANSKFYISLTSSNNQNYLIESLTENFSKGENICASFSYLITTYEVGNEI